MNPAQIVATACKVVQANRKNRPLSVAHLAAFIDLDDALTLKTSATTPEQDAATLAMTLKAMGSAPTHVQSAFGLTVLAPAMPPSAFRGNRPTETTSPYRVRP